MLSKLICGRSWHFSSLFFSSQQSSFYSFVPEALWCCFLQPSSCFIKDHVLLMIVHLTGVSCPLFKFSHLIKFCVPSQMECCPNYIILNPSLSWINRSGFNIYLALQPQGFSQCSLSLFSNGVFSTMFTSLYSFLEFVQPLKVLWFHSFVKEAT